MKHNYLAVIKDLETGGFHAMRENARAIRHALQTMADIETGKCVVVPVEPTQKMIDAAFEETASHPADIEGAYKAMIQAAGE